MTNFFMPLAIRRRVAGASGFGRSKMLLLGIVQSMHSAAVRHFCWPDNRLTVATGNHEQAFAAGRRAEVAGPNDSPLDDISQVLQLGDKRCPSLAASLRIGYQKLLVDRNDFARGGDTINHAFRLGRMRYQVKGHDPAASLAALGDQRPPLEDLFHVLQTDDSGFFLAGPLQTDPRKVPDFALAWLSAGGLAVVRAVRRHVEPANGLATTLGVRITIENVGGVVHGAWVIHRVHADRLRAVVLRDIYRATQAHLQPGTGAATTAEEVDNDLIVLSAEAESVLSFEIEGVFLLLCGHRGSSPGIFGENKLGLEMILDIRRKGLIGTLVGHAILLACLIVVSTKADVQTNQVISGWLQAIGSVLAIVFAVIVANTQYLRAEEAKKQAAIEHSTKLAMHAGHLCAGMETSLKLMKAGGLTQADFDRHKKLLENGMRVYHAFSVDLIQSAIAFSAWASVGHACDDYLNHCRSNEGDIHMVIAVRLAHLERCLRRAEVGSKKLEAVLFSMLPSAT